MAQTARSSRDETPAVRVSDLRKRFGDTEALRGVSFDVEAGEIFGLVGPNGAGKSTTLRIMATLLNADSGTAEIFGADVDDQANAAREAMRYIPEEAGAYENLTGRQYLRFVADFYADGADADAMVDSGVDYADLGDRIGDQTSKYSKGMTRKLLLASAVMTEPQLAILDEPTSGLDVRNARQVRETIKTFPGEERCIILSSHDMLEVEYLCDRVGLIDEGEIVAEGTPEALIERYEADNLETVFLEATA